MLQISAVNRRMVRLHITTTDIASVVLRGGVIISTLMIGLGLMLFLLTGHSGYATASTTFGDYTTFHMLQDSGAYFPTSLEEIAQGVSTVKPFAIIMLGLLLLMATPVINIMLIGLSFFWQRNRVYGLISLFILTMLVLGWGLGV